MKLLRLLPLPLRQEIAHLRRKWRDFQTRTQLSDRRHDLDTSHLRQQLEIRQPILGGALLENKLSNLALGSSRIDGSTIGPGETWSFWKAVGRPSAGNGFREGRNLVDGQLSRQVGGGLCQLSGLLYHLGLLAGLTVTERHPHSLDIYQEHERFTPLGSDATVVWGYKDLRLSNPHPFDVALECFVSDQFLTGRTRTEARLPPIDIDFLREPLGPDRERVSTMVGTELHARTVYRRKLPT